MVCVNVMIKYMENNGHNRETAHNNLLQLTGAKEYPYMLINYILRLPLLIILLLTSPLLSAATDKGNLLFSEYQPYVELAAASYEDLEKAKETLNLYGYELTLYNKDELTHVVFFIATNHQTKSQVIVIRGTSNIENALIDVALRLKHQKTLGIDLHEGFSLAAKGVLRAIRSQILPTYAIKVTGHSLGGAVALVLGMHLKVGGFTNLQVITFGQPRVTNKEGAIRFAGLDVIRFATEDDLVPLVPPVDMSELDIKTVYWHIGKEMLLLDGNKYAVLDEVQSMVRTVSVLGEKLDINNLQQHQMTVYQSHFMDKLRSSKQLPYKTNKLFIYLLNKL